MIRKPYLCLIVGFLVLAFITCSGCPSKKPKDFPATVPCKIVVLKGGNPLSDATVQLIPKTQGTGWIVGGETDAQGVVALRTQQVDYATPGAPEGTYTVVITKTVPVEGELPQEELQKMSLGELDTYAAKIDELRKKAVPIVPPVLTLHTSPLTFDISKTADSFTVELDDYK